MDKLDAMRMFVAVVDSGGFASAARKLRCSPAAVTRAVAQLEGELGVALLTRTTRSVKTTESGSLWATNCRRVLSDLAESEEIARGQRTEPHGLLHISAPIAMGAMHVQPAVESLLQRFPDLRIRLSLSDRLAHLVEDEVDVAVRIGELAESNLIAVLLGHVRNVWVASPKYLKQRGHPARAQDLAAHDVIDFEALSSMSGARLGRSLPAKVPRFSANSSAAAIAAAEAGLGITSALSYQVQALIDAKRLTAVLSEQAGKKMPVHVVYPGNRRASVNVSAFTSELRSRLRSAAGVQT